MPIQPPSRAELVRIAEAYHLSLSEDEVATFAELAGPTLAGFERLDELPGGAHRMTPTPARLRARVLGLDDPTPTVPANEIG